MMQATPVRQAGPVSWRSFWLRLYMENQPNDGNEISRLTILTLELKIANDGKHVADFING